MDTTNIISLLVGLLGLMGTIFFGLKARNLSTRIRRFSWEDIDSGVKFIHQKVSMEFQPDIILSSSAGSVGIVANLFVTHSDKFIPYYMGISKKIDSQFTSDPLYDTSFKTNRWETYLPNEVFSHKDKNVLILEDLVLSGDTITKMKEILELKGFDRNKIFTAALFTTDMAITANRAPDIYWYRIADTHFYLPWGRSVGRGY